MATGPIILEPSPELQQCIANGVEAALRAFALGQQIRPAKPRDNGDPEGSWRSAVTLRYGKGTWKRDYIEVTPFRAFRPHSEFTKGEIAKRLRAAHPNHNHLESAIANTTNELVRDGVLVKLAPGVYAPAINSMPVVDAN